MTITVQLCRVSPDIDPNEIIDAYEKAYANLCDEMWGLRDTEDFRKRADILSQEFGFDSCGLLECVRPLDPMPSFKHPEHPFRIDYWFSGYTARSLFQVVYRHTGEDLGYLIDTAHFYIKPDWEKLAEEVSRARQLLEESYRGVDVYETGPNPFRDVPEIVKSPRQALKFFLSENTNDVSGSIFEEPLGLRAVLHGSSSHMPGKPATYIIYEWTKEHFQWYIDALDVIMEQAEYALSHGPDEFILRRNREFPGLKPDR